MRILFLESFHGGSHRDFALDVQRLSAHHITLLTLPARHWKWRQGGSAFAFMDMMNARGESFADYDRIILTGLTDLNLLKSLTPLPPVLLYLHETQFHYPLGPGEGRDYHYGLKDLTNILAADRVVFNSRYHGETFFAECRRFLEMMPDFSPLPWLEEASKKWEYVYPGFAPFPAGGKGRTNRGEPPVLLWNHRWEHDKNPHDFLQFLRRLSAGGNPFRLILLGERFRRYPAPFDDMMREFAPALLTSRFAESREEYLDWLGQADYVVSTALQENFGIAVVEALSAGALPLLPDRLSYPELLGEDFSDFLYRSVEDLVRLFQEWENRPPSPSRRESLRSSMDRFSRVRTVPLLDQMLENMSS